VIRNRALWGALVLCAGTACTAEPTFRGVDVTSGRAIELSRDPASLPSFEGSYRSAQLGELLLRQERKKLHGTYVQSFGDCEIVGSLEGSITNNLAEFRWAEQDSCPNGVAVLRGRGFVFYVEAESSDSRARLFGRRMQAGVVPSVPPGRGWPTTEDLGVISAVRR
jgi:hypothetical protein